MCKFFNSFRILLIVFVWLNLIDYIFLDEILNFGIIWFDFIFYLWVLYLVLNFQSLLIKAIKHEYYLIAYSLSKFWCSTPNLFNFFFEIFLLLHFTLCQIFDILIIFVITVVLENYVTNKIFSLHHLPILWFNHNPSY